MKFSKLLGATALATATVFASQAAVAQTAKEKSNQTEQKTEEASEGIVVTGSRIRQPNQESVSPITTVTGDQFFETGRISVGDVLNDLPQLRNTYSQQNSTRFLGTRGLNLLDLRGLGTSRTLVLVNGRRHVAGDILVNGVSPDVNTIPTDLIESVDVITGGQSSIYGSDAIAGVVNFKLKQNYDGLQVRGQAGANVDYKDAGNQYVSVLGGKNFAEGRGNIALNVEYAHSSPYYGSNRPNLRQNDGFVVVDTDPPGTPNGSDGVFDRQFFRDIRSATISTGGQLGFASPTGACGRDLDSNAAFTCAFLFQPDGTLIPQTGTRVGIAPNGNFLGGNGYSGREGKLLTLSPDLERISVNALGHFDISPALVPFFEAKYTRTRAFGSTSGPFFSQGTTLGDPAASTAIGNRERPRLDNPYLTAQARAIIEQQLRAGGSNPTDATRFSLRKNWVEFGIRDEKITRETFRIVGGVRGDFNDDWNYEVSVNYGEHKENNLIQGNINKQRYLLAIDAVRDPASGNIVCRSKINPAAGIGIVNNAAILAQDIAACVPLNPFGDNSSSQAVRNYLTMASNATGKITQFVASGYVSGDSSQLFELPGGPVAFSVGAEYRRETNYYDLDDLTQAGYAFYNAIPEFKAPAFEVKEAFGELSIPVLRNTPFFHDLTLKGSGRVANYKGKTGTVFAWDAGINWSPIRDLRLRATYSRSVRAPNLSELYSAQSQNFATVADPCSKRNIGTGSSTRAANCAAAGVPAGYDYVYVQSLEIVSGGNPNLKQETSTSYTIGGVFEPRFVPGLSLSVDYYDINVENVIASVGAQTILNQCYDQATLNNPFCSLFKRAGASGGPRGEIPFQVLEGSLLQSTLNFARLKARGIDTNLTYRHKFDWGTVNMQGIYTRTLQRDNFTNPADPGRIDRILGELGDPENEFNLNASVKLGKVTFGYQLHWIDKMYLNAYEDYNSLQGRPPENADYASIRKYPSVFYHSARVDVDVNDRFNLYVGMDNIGNRFPPFGLTGTGGGSGIYDTRGRYGYVGFVAKF